MTIVWRIIIMLALTGTMNAQWTSVFHQRLNEEHVKRATNNVIIFTKENVSPFSQLLFSWNAFRPQQGFYTFYVQARNTSDKTWGTWHRMSDWGAGVQRSYENKGDFSRFIHVRLEVKSPQLADAFRVKVMAQKGATFTDLKGFTITLANGHAFKHEPYGEHIEQLASVHVQNVPKISQFALEHPDNSRICSPTSCTMLMRYLTGAVVDPLEFARHSYDKGLGAYGSWPFNMAHAFERCNGKGWFFNTRLNSFTELHAQLARGIPVAVSVRGKIHGAPREYPNGHLLLVTGWDSKKKQVICHDPAVEMHNAVEKRYTFADFNRAWELSWRLVYWVEPVASVL